MRGIFVLMLVLVTASLIVCIGFAADAWVERRESIDHYYSFKGERSPEQWKAFESTFDTYYECTKWNLIVMGHCIVGIIIAALGQPYLTGSDYEEV